MFNLKGTATKLFGPTVDKYEDLFVSIKEILPKADIKIPFRTYLSTALFISTFSLIFTSIITLVVLLIFGFPFYLGIIYAVFSSFLVGIVSFVLMLFYPFQKAASRRKNINTNLPFVLAHMGAIAESGIPPYVIFKLISKFEEYGEISKEMKKIVRNIEAFGIDPLTAVKQIAERTPSEEFKEVLLGFITTTESGGDVKLYLKNAGDQALFEWRMKREKFIQQLSAYAEFYTGILIAAPLFIIALFSIMNMIQPTISGFSILDLTKISLYVVVPVLNIGFITFLRGVEVEM
jgi:flagellar protein FlaJ